VGGNHWEALYLPKRNDELPVENPKWHCIIQLECFLEFVVAGCELIHQALEVFKVLQKISADDSWFQSRSVLPILLDRGILERDQDDWFYFIMKFYWSFNCLLKPHWTSTRQWGHIKSSKSTSVYPVPCKVFGQPPSICLPHLAVSCVCVKLTTECWASSPKPTQI